MRQWLVDSGGGGRMNIMFGKSYPMKHGKFPKEHPCADDPRPMVMGPYRSKPVGATEFEDVPGEQPESGTSLGKLRAMGYWCSCFPEGDGITVQPLQGQTLQQLADDASLCFFRSVHVLRLS